MRQQRPVTLIAFQLAQALVPVAMAMLILGCASHYGPAGTAPFAATGGASYYAARFDGRRTASGETFDSSRLTAAHRTLPFGTLVKVTALDTGRSVVVRINDRGPFVSGRVIDLSLAAARRLQMLRSGISQVRLDVVKWPSPLASAE